MYCGECGHSVDDGDEFCSQCGAGQNAGAGAGTGAMSYDELLAQRAGLWATVDTIQSARLSVSSAERIHGSVATVDPPLELGGGTPLAELQATVTTIDQRSREIDEAQAGIRQHQQAVAALEAKSKNVRTMVIGALIGVPLLILLVLVMILGAVL